MLKKSAILGLVLLLAGIIALQWILTKKKQEQQQFASYRLKYGTETDEYLKQYNEWLQLAPEEKALIPLELDKSDKAKSGAQLHQQQRERLKADLNKLAVGDMQIYPFADVLYGKNWQNELIEYKSQRELREAIFTSSIVCTSTGAVLFTWCILLWTIRQIIKVSYHLRHLQTFLVVFDKPFTQIFANLFKNKRRNKGKKLFSIGTKKSKGNSGQGQNPYELNGRAENYSAELVNSGWQNPAFVRRDSKSTEIGQKVQQTKNAKGIAVLLSDEKTFESKTATEKPIVNTLQVDLPQNAEMKTASNSGKNMSKLEDSLKAQAENLEKRMSEFKQMAKTVQQTTLENSQPLNNAIKDLTQQVSAIRQYAACQQDRMEKLQDGYDWNIIRTFCLRIIRCIDNLENRISQLSKNDIDTTDLQEIKDELVFGLESSGVEQFEPEIDSDYRGQEKFAEAIKDKQQCDDPKKTGKIAQVVRPGYQYFINEDNIKVVRTAQVKLFG